MLFLYLISILPCFVFVILHTRYNNKYHKITTGGDIILATVLSIVPIINSIVVIFITFSYTVIFLLKKIAKFNKKIF